MFDTDPRACATPRLSFFVAEGFASGLAMVDMRPAGDCTAQRDVLREKGNLWHGAMQRWFGLRGLEAAP